ncbi:MAG: cobalamin-binding protein [Rubrivivax sp.]|nr:MAG: cobalamin-binding protein [Rubrivivax sp.]
MTAPQGPQRIACLSTESVDVLYRLGAQDRIAGISGFTVHPPQARDEKPKISGFKTGKLERILDVQPDLVIGFSEVQRPLLDACAEAGVEVMWFNHRSLAGISDMIRTLGQTVQRDEAAEGLVAHLEGLQAKVALAAQRLPFKPRVYFEEWHSPLICGIAWISEIIQLAGGIDVFADTAQRFPSRERAVTPEQVLAAEPQLILGAWCGQRFEPEKVLTRDGFPALGATMLDVPSSDILSPGPACIERGLLHVFDAIARRAGTTPQALGFNA